MSTDETAVYQRKLQEAKRLIDTHNYLRKPTLNDTRVVYEDFVSRLVEMGGTSDEMLQRITSRDLHEVCGLPILMARRLAEIFDDSWMDDIGAISTGSWKPADPVAQKEAIKGVSEILDILPKESQALMADVLEKAKEEVEDGTL